MNFCQSLSGAASRASLKIMVSRLSPSLNFSRSSYRREPHGKSVIELSHELLARFHRLEGLLEASISELMAVKGIGKAKAIQLKAAFGIALKRSPSPV